MKRDSYAILNSTLVDAFFAFVGTCCIETWTLIVVIIVETEKKSPCQAPPTAAFDDKLISCFFLLKIKNIEKMHLQRKTFGLYNIQSQFNDPSTNDAYWMHFNGLDFRENEMQFVDIPNYHIPIHIMSSNVRTNWTEPLNRFNERFRFRCVGIQHFTDGMCSTRSILRKGFPWYLLTFPICTTCTLRP